MFDLLQQTRPTLAYAVSVVSQFLHDLMVRYLQEVDRVLQYLKATPGRGIEAYTDVDSVSDRRSSSRHCTFLCGNLVTSRSKKQNVMP